jgi:hypothetical protein
MADLAVVIVTWNVRALALEALRTLYADIDRSVLHTTVYVVDNASADGTLEAVRAAYPNVIAIQSGGNIGFGAANNLALRALGFGDQPAANDGGPRAVLLLNPDTLVQPGALRTLYDALFSLPRAGLVGPQLQYEDGAFQHSAFRQPDLLQIVLDLYPLPDRLRGALYESRLNGRYPRALYAAGVPFAVDFVLGAAMLLRREAIEATGLFDEGYFMYAEEVDWARRIRRAGYGVYSVPAARITHLEGRSAAQARPGKVLNLWRSRFRYYDKHEGQRRGTLARLVARPGLWWQMVRARRAAEREALLEAYRQVLRL